MKTIQAILCLSLLGTTATTGFSQTTNRLATREEEMVRVLASVTPPPQPGEEPPSDYRLSFNESGQLRYLGAPQGKAFASGAARVAGRPDETARHYLVQHGIIFGLEPGQAEFTVLRTRQSRVRNHVRLLQAHQGVPIFAAQVLVQLNGDDDVEAILADLPARLGVLEEQGVGTAPGINREQAADAARAHLSGLVEKDDPIGIEDLRLTLYMPEVLGRDGRNRLVWEMIAACRDEMHVGRRVLVDAHTAEIVRAFELHCGALNRRIFDMNDNLLNNPPPIARDEGDPPAGINDVDLAYQFIADTYNFYNTRHSRDSYDDAGAQIWAVVRWCSGNTNVCPTCPCPQAFSGNGNSVTSPMVFGNGFVTDDVVAHEFTHRVTQQESGLIYQDASGAINESFSDLWGEFVDLIYGNGGDDSAAVRWLIGEDIGASGGAGSGSLRDMANPPTRNHPDRVSSPFYQPPSNTSDNGGVHTNSGVNNKLAFLLTDGQLGFNGQDVSGMGVNRVAALYYEAQTKLLFPAAGWADLGNALRQAALNLGWSADDQNNLYRACLAVEILTPNDVYVDGSSLGCVFRTGRQVCHPWMGGPYPTVNYGLDRILAGDRMWVRQGVYSETVFFNKAMTVRSYEGAAVIGAQPGN